MNRRSLFFFLAVLVIADSGASAPPERLVRFSVFSASGVENVVYSRSPNTRPVPLVFYPTARSPEYTFRGDGPIRFQEVNSGTTIAEATIAPDVARALLVFEELRLPSPAGARYRVRVLDDGGLRHNAGQLSIVNLSGLRLFGTVGTASLQLRSGANEPIPVGRGARILLRVDVNGRAYQAYAGAVELSGTERGLLILLPPYYAGSVEAQSRLLVDTP